MSVYNNILVAIDLHPACDEPTVRKATEIAQANNAKLTIIHAVEHINAYGMAQAYPTVIDLEEQMAKDAKDALAKFSTQFNIPPQNQFIEVGSPKVVILNKAQDLKIDLIIVGSHGRHGIELLLGSTANAILHNAKCDVLAVRISE